MDIARLLHGSAATAWMLLPLLQYWLVRSGARKLHRLVGYTSLALAAFVVVTGLRFVQAMDLRNVDDFQIRRIKFVWLDLSGLLLFCVFPAWQSPAHESAASLCMFVWPPARC